MAALDYDETKELVRLVLNRPAHRARFILFRRLASKGKSEGQFYEGIMKHATGLGLTSEQWFELLSRLPNRMLHSGLDISHILSEEQRSRLPPATG